MNCEHPQCCICLKRECQISRWDARFRKYGDFIVCGDSCVTIAIAVAYDAARRLGGTSDKPCGRPQKIELTDVVK